MNYDFYAGPTDAISIFEFIFSQTDLDVYELSSELGEEICRFESVDELTSKFGSESESKSQLTFQLWSPRHGGRPVFRRVSLDPAYCDGHTFRYATEGYGLIQLYFGRQRKMTLERSHIGHFTEGRARLLEADNPSLGKSTEWDWKEIQTTSRRLKYQIHNKMSVRKIGSFGILPGAEILFSKGIERVL